MHRPATAERHQAKTARVAAALAGDGAERPAHGGVGKHMHAEGRVLQAEAERPGDLIVKRRHRLVIGERQVAADQEPRVQVPQRQVGVGHRRRGAALVIADRSRHRAGTIRPDRERAAGVDPDQAAAAGADLGDVDRRHPDVIAAAGEQASGEVDAAADVEGADPVEPPGLDHRRLGRRAAHVEGQQVGTAEPRRDLRRADHPGSRPRLDDVDRPQARGRDSHGAAVRLHHQQRRGDLEPAQHRLQAAEIVGHHRQDIGVDHGGAGALVLLDLGQHLGGEADRDRRVAGTDQLPDAALVGAVGIGVEQADGDRLDAGRQQRVDGAAGRRLVQRPLDPAPVVDPLRHLDAMRPVDQRRRLLPVEVVEHRHAQAPDLQHVAEALSGDQPGPGALLLNDRVGRDRGAVDHLVDRRAGQTMLGEARR